jgi:exopolysaccharide production protein ExoZ
MNVSSGGGKIYSIETVRGLAALMIVVLHANEQIFGRVDSFLGFGVDIFFVISGFVMWHVHSEDPASGWVKFSRKRLVRIVPMYWLATFLYIIVLIVMPGNVAARNWGALEIFQSIFFIPFYTDDIGWYPLLKLGWSLNYEIYFYIMFVGCYFFRTRLAKFLFINFSILAVVVLGTFFEGAGVVWFYSNPIVIEFLFGVFIAFLFGKRVLVNLLFSGWMLLLACVLVYLFGRGRDSIYLLGYSDGFVRLLAWGVPSALMVYALLCLEDNCGYALENFCVVRAASLFLGGVSYALYLFHPFVIRLVALKVAGVHSLVYFSMVLIGSVIVAAVIQRNFDQPVRVWLNNLLPLKV